MSSPLSFDNPFEPVESYTAQSLGTQLQPTTSRSRSFVSFDLRSFNETVGRWKRELSFKLPHWYLRSEAEATPNEIYFSVFQPAAHYGPIPAMPSDGFMDSGPISKAVFDSLVEDCIEAIDRGLAPKRIAAGSSGSYFVYNTQERIVAVFKPKDEEPYGPLSPKWTKWIHRNLFPFFFGRSCLIPNLGYICEAAASLLDRQLQTHIVPYTDTVSLSSDSFYYTVLTRRKYKGRQLPKKVGSFQLFLKGYMEADQFFQKYPFPGTRYWTANSRYAVPYSDEAPGELLYFEWTPRVVQQFREELEKLVILDYIMRNTDRGLDNWMIKIEWEDDSSVACGKVPHLKIGAIDSGLSWPWKHPDEWRSFPFGWLFLPLNLIGQPFCEATRQHFLPLLTSVAWWEESTLLFRQLFARDVDFKERLWKKQLAVMKGQAYNVVETLKITSQGPLDLARKTRILVWDEEIDVPVQSKNLGSQSGPVFVDTHESPVRKARIQRENSAIDTIVESNLDSVINSGAADPDELFDEDLENLQSSWTELLNGNISERKFDKNTHGKLFHPGSGKKNEESEGFVIEKNSATKRVIVEKLEKVTSRPPVFTWC